MFALCAMVYVAPPPLRFSFLRQPLAGKPLKGNGATSMKKRVPVKPQKNLTLLPLLRASQLLCLKSIAHKMGSGVCSNSGPRRKRSASLNHDVASKAPRTSAAKGKQPLARSPSVWRTVFDGSVSEADHLTYHLGHKGFCVRCDMQSRGKVLEALAMHDGKSWLSIGINGGLWGLGCTVCSRYLASGSTCKHSRLSGFDKVLIYQQAMAHRIQQQGH